MKAKRFISFLFCMSLFSGACAAPEEGTEGASRGQSADAAIDVSSIQGEGAEHCLAADKSTCFLEIDSAGKSQFFATGESYEKLLVDPILAEINIQLQPIDGEGYEFLKAESKAKVVYEGAESNAVDVYAESMDESSNFIVLIFRIVSFLWKGSGYVDTAKTAGGILSKIPGIDKLANKASEFKDKLKDKLKDKIKDIFTKDETDDTANSLKAKITWHSGTSVLTREVPIPEEILNEQGAELESDGVAASVEAAAEL